jgi:single stranded DNA-binding protein
MYNCITLVGNIGGESKFETTSGGKPYAICSLATHRYAGGDKKTDWHKIIFWDEKKVEVLKKFTRVGSKILVQGYLTYNTWERDGVTQKSSEIHVGYGGAIELLDSKGDHTSVPTANTSNPPEGMQNSKDEELDAIPF